MAEFLLRIQSPFKSEQLTVEWVSIQSPSGSFLVGPGHQPLISMLTAQSAVVYKTAGQQRELTVGETGGMVHVKDNTVILFL